ncbi:thioredoxin domain-containing protein [Sinorhizobium prairiense]|uniref:hydrogenase accessory protein n=1 Tax=unclassified Sinorhizobium TaxID=2613772 RepID=UPI0023D8A514|nr:MULTISPECIES: hydrogenase accessory protein [unclassified Sinorhizobium]WEJ08692.1 hydrogenase accessory protein [Sinorhizobium sp. M103]WEJ13806.1 hydrogenase accessory protein [Sinorhizobium sp. K101]WEJ35408.1 hydrogenase accessory protein [Sinorhizobium sp. C101]
MPSILVRAVSERVLSVVDETDIDARVVRSSGEPDDPGLVFTGNPARPETEDVAVVRPELPQFARSPLRGSLVRRKAEGKLKARLNVVVPILTVMGRERPAGAPGNVRGWSEYVEIFGAWLSCVGSVKAPLDGPKVKITHAGKAIVR